MRKLFLVSNFLVLAACTESVTDVAARRIACERLEALEGGPDISGQGGCPSLAVVPHNGGRFLVEFQDRRQGLIWAVIVHPSGDSEVSKMAIDG